jgi:general nucleoside transport system permease protein
MPFDILETSIVVSVLAATVRIATPVLLAALGEVVAERSGVYNMGVEGTMLLGALAAYLAAYATGSVWIGAAAGAVAGLLTSLIFAFLVISLRVEQIVTGLAINLLGSGLSVYSLRALFKGEGQIPAAPIFGTLPMPVLRDIPVIGPMLFEQKALTYIAIAAVPAIWFFLYRTRQGLDLRCAGENPKALDIKGLSVAAYQYAGVLFGGFMAGLGGAFLTVGSAARFAPEMTNGRGWLAIVIVIAGLWRPVPILVAALVFAFLDALQLQIQGVGIAIPYQLLLALPYIVAILALAIRRTQSGAPAMLGITYTRA